MTESEQKTTHPGSSLLPAPRNSYVESLSAHFSLHNIDIDPIAQDVLNRHKKRCNEHRDKYKSKCPSYTQPHPVVELVRGLHEDIATIELLFDLALKEREATLSDNPNHGINPYESKSMIAGDMEALMVKSPEAFKRYDGTHSEAAPELQLIANPSLINATHILKESLNRLTNITHECARHNSAINTIDSRLKTLPEIKDANARYTSELLTPDIRRTRNAIEAAQDELHEILETQRPIKSDNCDKQAAFDNQKQNMSVYKSDIAPNETIALWKLADRFLQQAQNRSQTTLSLITHPSDKSAAR